MSGKKSRTCKLYWTSVAVRWYWTCWWLGKDLLVQKQKERRCVRLVMNASFVILNAHVFSPRATAKIACVFVPQHQLCYFERCLTFFCKTWLCCVCWLTMSVRKSELPVTVLFSDDLKNVSLNATLIVGQSAGDAEPTPAPYDAKGAMIFSIVVITVYGISIVLFIASLITRKKDIIDDEAEENNTVTQYLTQVAELKEKTARDHFRKLKMGIKEKMERDLDKEDLYEDIVLPGKTPREKRLHGSPELRQPLLQNECGDTVVCGPPPSYRDFVKSSSYHSIGEIDETKRPIRSSVKPCISQHSYSAADVHYSSDTWAENTPPRPARSSKSGKVNFVVRFAEPDDSDSEDFLDGSESLLLPLPPPAAFSQGYRREHHQGRRNAPDFSDSSSEDIFEDQEPDSFEPQMQSSLRADSRLVAPNAPGQFRDKAWPPSPSLGLAAQASLGPSGKARRYHEEEWSDKDIAGSGGFVLRTLSPMKTGSHRLTSPVQTFVRVAPVPVEKTLGNSTVSSL